MTTYGLLLFDNAEELDFVGPWEVFTASKMLRAAKTAGEDTTLLLAKSLDTIQCAKGMRVLPDRKIGDHPALDVVLVPGGQGTRTVHDDAEIGAWLRSVHEHSTWTTSVCTGSLVLASAGPARDGRVATHWSFEDRLIATGLVKEVVRDQRWVVDGKVVTSQGVSAGIDMALWLIGQLHGPDHAREVQHYIAYDPAPPYQDGALSPAT